MLPRRRRLPWRRLLPGSIASALRAAEYLHGWLVHLVLRLTDCVDASQSARMCNLARDPFHVRKGGLGFLHQPELSTDVL